MTRLFRYRLQMLSSGLTQSGEDDEGINGFLPADINIELDRAAKMVIDSPSIFPRTPKCLLH